MDVDCSALIGTPIAGALINADHGSFDAVVGYSAGSILVGSVFSVFARMCVSKWKIFAKV